jgi:hypothetical protein
MDIPRHAISDDMWYAMYFLMVRGYGLVKLEAPKNGQEDPSWLQVFNERVKWL